MEEALSAAVESGFSPTRKAILAALKRSGGLSLTDVAKEVGVSKMAALKHLTALEDKGFVERSQERQARGRPRAHFALTRKSQQLFPQAYTQLTMAALTYIDEKLGRKGVVELLESRGRELHDRHRADFRGKDLKQRVETLVKIRDEAGYMAEISSRRRDGFELKEHNCPILAVAGNYWEACAAETKLFERLLKADVDATHRMAAGEPVCCFQIRKRPS